MCEPDEPNSAEKTGRVKLGNLSQKERELNDQEAATIKGGGGSKGEEMAILGGAGGGVTSCSCKER